MRTMREIFLFIAILNYVGLLTGNSICYTLYYLGIILSVSISLFVIIKSIVKEGVEEKLNTIIIGILLNSIITITMGNFSSGMSFYLILILFAKANIWQANNIEIPKKDYIIIEIN